MCAMTKQELAEIEHLRYRGPYIPYEERWRQFNEILLQGIIEAVRTGHIDPSMCPQEIPDGEPDYWIKVVLRP